jgi:hypothetical protein
VNDLEEKRKGEIAYTLLKHYVARKGIPIASLRRELGNVAKVTRIPAEELKNFFKSLFEEICKEALA